MRLFLSFLTLLLFGSINVAFNTGATIADGKLAGLQFADSDSAAVVAQTGMRFISGGTLSFFLVFVILGFIWYKPIINAIKGSNLPVALLILALSTAPAFAYYDKTDYNESVYVTPNQSAFWIPDVGDIKSSQV